MYVVAYSDWILNNSLKYTIEGAVVYNSAILYITSGWTGALFLQWWWLPGTLNFLKPQRFVFHPKNAPKQAYNDSNKSKKKRNTTTFTGMTERNNKKYMLNIKIDQNSDTSSRWRGGREGTTSSASFCRLASAFSRSSSARSKARPQGPLIRGRSQWWGGFSGTPCRDTHCLMEDLANQLLVAIV